VTLRYLLGEVMSPASPAGRSPRTPSGAPTGLPGWPRFDGRFSTDEAGTGAAALDFGHLVRLRPRAVLEAASEEDVARLVRHARAAGVRVAPRGEGHSVYGQAQVDGGVVACLRRLDRIHSLTPQSATVDAGVRWSQLVERAAHEGVAPPVLPDFLDLSVGGTFSVGGIGGTSFRHGAQVDHVDELVVVTGEGEIVICSEVEEPRLFESAWQGSAKSGSSSGRGSVSARRPQPCRCSACRIGIRRR
jgi:cytokinin dehydrogenase